MIRDLTHSAEGEPSVPQRTVRANSQWQRRIGGDRVTHYSSPLRRGRMAADDFTQVRNALFRDPRVSFKAKGIFGLISTHRDGFGITPAAIAACGTDGISAVNTALRELESVGYLQRERIRNEDGTLRGTVYYITDQPEHPRRSEPNSDCPHLDKPLVDDDPTKKTRSKKTRDQKTEDPSAPAADAADTGDGFGTAELFPIFDSPAVSASKPKGAGDGTEAARKRLASQLVAAYIDALPSNQGRGEGEASRAPASVSRAIGSAAKRLTIDGGYADSEFLAAFERAGRANRLDVAKFLTDPQLGSSRGTYREEAQSRRHAQWAADAAALASESTWATGRAQIGTSGRTGQMQHHSAPALTTTPWERS